ncbi:MAG: high light inducible protein [Spirulinaceae cyanobacterium SM2_1_0]|nr:high light inducible protein [Spirulinaceae cyanobacterium SM2_1_0]
MTVEEPPNSQPESPTPSSATEPAAAPTPTFGFNAYAETLNGRFAMIGFTILLLLELLTGQDLFTWLGLR